MERRDNVCKTLWYEELILRHELRDIISCPLPAGYSFRFYQPGDASAWLEIEQSAREFLSAEEGQKSWAKYFGGHEEELTGRMLFVLNSSGQPVATATAYHDAMDERAGWLHWVAVRRTEQGKGLSKPLVLRALSLLRELGYPYACVPTQTTTWLAVKVYLDCGFTPLNIKEGMRGWRIVRTLTEHPALTGFPPLPEAELYNPWTLAVEGLLRARYPELLDFNVWTEGPPRAGVLLPEGARYFSLLRRPDGSPSLGAEEKRPGPSLIPGAAAAQVPFEKR